MTAVPLGPDALLAPLREALAGAPADEAELWLHRRRAAVVRYSHSEIHQSAVHDETHVHARAVVSKAVGIATTNAADVGSLRRLVADAAALARLAPANADWPGLAEPAETPAPHAYDEATASTDAAAQARAIASIVAAADAAGLRVAGTHAVDLTEDAVANSNGVAQYAPATVAYVRALAQSDSASGYADDLAARASDLDVAGVAERAIEKCAYERATPRELPPGEYEAVFEELAVAEVLRVMSIHGLSGRSVREGRSFMSGRIGDAVTGPRFTLHDDALDHRQIGIPFDVEGTPKRHVPLVVEGVARSPVYDRAAARQAGVRSTGHAADRGRHEPGGHAGNLVMAGGDATHAELVGAVKRGLLITRFHYTNSPDPSRATMTGTSRDGTFLIEDGRIVGALANVRYTMSALDLFAGLELLGPQRLVRDWWSTNGMGSIVCLAPAIKVARATITGSSPS